MLAAGLGRWEKSEKAAGKERLHFAVLVSPSGH